MIIEPISNPDEIRKEKEDNKPPSYPASQASTEPQTRVTQDGSATQSPTKATSSQQIYFEPKAQPTSRQSYQTDGAGVVLNASLQDGDNDLFGYRLPVSSYVLSVLNVYSFYQLAIVPLAALVLLYGSLSPGAISGETLKNILPFFAFIALAVLLLVNKKAARWAALAVSGAMIGYAIYIMGKSSQASAGYDGSMSRGLGAPFYIYAIITALPYVLPPVVTFIYLLLPKAARAYR